MARSIALAALLYALPIAAKTDIEGCTSFTSTVVVNPSPGYGNTYETVIYYVSDTLEICKGVDCGGGRAPPRSVPGCPIYKGTETVTPEFLDSDPMAPQTADSSEEESSQITPAPTLTSTEVEAEETEAASEEAEASSNKSQDAGASKTTDVESKETSAEERKTTAAATTSAEESDESSQTKAESDETSTGEEESPEATTVDSGNAGTGNVVTALNVVAGVAGALAWVL
ncbi:hypothetical protein ACJ41O_010930 [Fusarium nematophilum]